MKNNFWKGLFMGIIGIIGSLISNSETMVLSYILLTTVLFTCQYLVKNWLMPSVSDRLSVDLKDFLSGVLTAIFMGVSVYAGSLLTDVVFTWPALWKAVGVAFTGYFIKTVPSAKGMLK